MWGDEQNFVFCLVHWVRSCDVEFIIHIYSYILLLVVATLRYALYVASKYMIYPGGLWTCSQLAVLPKNRTFHCPTYSWRIPGSSGPIPGFLVHSWYLPIRIPGAFLVHSWYFLPGFLVHSGAFLVHSWCIPGTFYQDSLIRMIPAVLSYFNSFGCYSD